MGTTLIIVELVIIGFQVLVWVTLLLWPVLKPNLVHLKHMENWVPVVALSVVAMAYTLGVVFDRFLGFLASISYSQRLLKWLKLTFGHQTNEPTSTVTLTEKHYYIMQRNPEAYKQWEYNDRQVRLLRATFANAFLIAIIVCFKDWLYWKIWLSLFILGALAAITWITGRLRSDDALDQLYEIANPKAQNAEKHQGPKAV